jgi:ABC-type multidrug transport system ATPase subunit
MSAGWVLDAEGLTKEFGSKLAVDGVSVLLAPGEIVGLLGPNGAGKTTTLKMLLGMLRPSRGRALVLGLDSTTQSVAIKERVGYSPDEPSFYDFQELASSGVTVVLSTHLLDMADKLCTRVLLMDHGRLIFDGEPGAARAAAELPVEASLEDAFLKLVDA